MAAAPKPTLTQQIEARFYTADQVGKLFGVGRWTVYGWARQGRLPRLKVGKDWLFPVAAIDRFIERRTQLEHEAGVGGRRGR